MNNAHLASALLGFQKDAPPIHLDATNPHFGNKFVSLAGVVSAIRPILNKHGLVYAQFPTNIDGAPALETMLIHAESGEDIAAVTPLILTKNDPQGYGSALTYARRYALLSVLGLVGDEDDDANSALPQRGDARGNGTVETQPSDATPGVAQAPRETPPDAHDVVIHFGKNSGRKLGELGPKQVQWYAQTWEPNPEFANPADRRLKEAAMSLHLGIHAGARTVDDTELIPF